MIAKAASSEADLVFLDLEDAVAPSAKEAARHIIVEGLNGLDWAGISRAVRINSVDTPWCHGDLIEVVSGAGANIDVIIIPKVFGAREVWFVDDLLTQLETKLGLELGRIGLEVLVEEVEAVQRLDEIARSSPRLEALILGVGDLSASQGMRGDHIGREPQAPDGYPGDIWHYASTRLVIAARAAGLDAIGGPYVNFRDDDGYRRSASNFSMQGGVGKWCIHPSQVALANAAFAPSAEEIDIARAAVAAAKEAEAKGLGAANFNGVMLDAATTRLFQATLDHAARCGVVVSGAEPSWQT